MTKHTMFVVLASLLASPLVHANDTPSLAAGDVASSPMMATAFSMDQSGRWSPTPGLQPRPAGIPGDVLENPGNVIGWINSGAWNETCDPGFYVIPTPSANIDPYFYQQPSEQPEIPGLGRWDGDPYFKQQPKGGGCRFGGWVEVKPLGVGSAVSAGAGTAIVFAPADTDVGVLSNELATAMPATLGSATMTDARAF